MPYIITTTQALHEGERVVVDALESVGTRVVIGGQPIVSRMAVATLDEARSRIVGTVDSANYATPAGNAAATFAPIYDQIRTLPESGGTIGPLPDETVIEVRHVDWIALRKMTGELPVRTHDKPAVLAAFNARETR